MFKLGDIVMTHSSLPTITAIINGVVQDDGEYPGTGFNPPPGVKFIISSHRRSTEWLGITLDKFIRHILDPVHVAEWIYEDEAVVIGHLTDDEIKNHDSESVRSILKGD